MTKNDLVNIVAEKSGVSKKEAANVIAATIDALTECLVSDDKLTLPGFGTFDVKKSSERQGVNPATGEKITIKASKSARFKQSSALKEKLN